MDRSSHHYSCNTSKDYWQKRYRKLTGNRSLPRDTTPLRYPGGKGSLKYFLANTLIDNGIDGGELIEPFCGGSGASIPQLVSGLISRLHLNDANPAVAAFWECVFFDTDALVNLIRHNRVTVNQWHRHREVIMNQQEASRLELGFAAFFMNRCNRSGLLTSGPIGGFQQLGRYKIDCRFNKDDLISRIEKLGALGDRVTISCDDACDYLSGLPEARLRQSLVFIDPPYVNQGSNLYKGFSFDTADHRRLADFVKPHQWHWLITYDDHPLIHQLYAERAKGVVEFSYQMQQAKFGRELFVASSHCRIPFPPQEQASVLQPAAAAR